MSTRVKVIAWVFVIGCVIFILATPGKKSPPNKQTEMVAQLTDCIEGVGSNVVELRPDQRAIENSVGQRQAIVNLFADPKDTEAFVKPLTVPHDQTKHMAVRYFAVIQGDKSTQSVIRGCMDAGETAAL